MKLPLVYFLRFVFLTTLMLLFYNLLMTSVFLLNRYFLLNLYFFLNLSVLPVYLFLSVGLIPLPHFRLYLSFFLPKLHLLFRALAFHKNRTTGVVPQQHVTENEEEP